jgi:hypothetical protein
MTTELDTFVERYVEVWNDPDPDTRRRTVEALWAPDGTNYAPTLEAVGHDAIAARVGRSFAAFVADGGHRFQLAGPPSAHHGAVKLRWEMVELGTGEVASAGEEFLVLADDGRIRSDHQFLVR